MDTAIVVFARGREAEAKSLGSSRAEAARLSALLLQRTFETVNRSRASADVVLALDGELDPTTLPSLDHGAQLHLYEQKGEGFEARILGALEHGRALGYRRLVVVGVDTPSMSAADLRRACAAEHPVLGPSEDGGFYLLGLNAAELDRLSGLPWCTSRLLDALRLVFADAELELRPTRADLDRGFDLFVQRSRLERLALRLLGRSLADTPPTAPFGAVADVRSWRTQTGLAARGPPARVLQA